MQNDEETTKLPAILVENLPSELDPAAEMLGRIRPEWRDRRLVERVQILLSVDPSSACQRLLNAAFHDLRAKVQLLGLDLAGEVASLYKLPKIEKDEDLENYSVARLIDLAYRTGLVSRGDYRRLHRAYEIRRDLEHEDDEYEATPADMAYVFEASIDVVLSREPVQVLTVGEVEQIVEADVPVRVEADVVDDYTNAPDLRQLEIFERLVFWAIDEDRPDIVRSNCFTMLKRLTEFTRAHSRIAVAEKLSTRIGRGTGDRATAQVAVISGTFPYLKRRQQRMMTEQITSKFIEVTPAWRKHPYHGEILDDFESIGGFAGCPDDAGKKIVRWMLKCYIGEPGGYGTLGRNREVFYSNSAAHRITRLLKSAPPTYKGVVSAVAQEKGILTLVRNQAQRDRLNELETLTASVDNEGPPDTR